MGGWHDRKNLFPRAKQDVLIKLIVAVIIKDCQADRGIAEDGRIAFEREIQLNSGEAE